MNKINNYDIKVSCMSCTICPLKLSARYHTIEFLRLSTYDEYLIGFTVICGPTYFDIFNQV
jgi:hypothetical protein